MPRMAAAIPSHMFWSLATYRSVQSFCLHASTTLARCAMCTWKLLQQLSSSPGTAITNYGRRERLGIWQLIPSAVLEQLAILGLL